MTRTAVRRRRTLAIFTVTLAAAISWQLGHAALGSSAGAGADIPPGTAVAAPAAGLQDAGPSEEATGRTYVVREGDTLWKIASEAAPGADPRPLIARITAENGIAAGDIVPGQTLVIPDHP